MKQSTYTPNEVCRELGISRITLMAWENRGVLIPKRVEPFGWRLFERAKVKALKRRLVKDRRPGFSLLVEMNDRELARNV